MLSGPGAILRKDGWHLAIEFDYPRKNAPARARTLRRCVDGSAYRREDLFLARFLPGIIFFTARLAELAALLTVCTARDIEGSMFILKGMPPFGSKRSLNCLCGKCDAKGTEVGMSPTGPLAGRTGDFPLRFGSERFCVVGHCQTLEHDHACHSSRFSRASLR